MPTPGFFYGSLPPSLQQSYKYDPREIMAQQLLEQGSSGKPLRGGATEGILRLANALVGAYSQRKIGEQYQQRGAAYNTALANALSGVKPGHLGTDAEGKPTWISTDTTSLQNFATTNPDAGDLGQQLQVAQLQKNFGTDAAVQALQAKNLFDPEDWKDPEFRKFKLDEAKLLGAYRIYGPTLSAAASAYDTTGIPPPILSNALYGSGGPQVPGAAPPQPPVAPQVGSVPPVTHPDQLSGPGATLGSGGGLPIMPPKGTREQLSKDAGEEISGAVKSGAAASEALSKSPIYEEAIKGVEHTGPLGSAIYKGRQVLSDVAPDTFKAPVYENMVDQMNKELTFAQNFDPSGKRVFAGNFSDADRNFVSASAAGLGDTKEGLALKYSMWKKLKEREVQVGRLAQQYGGDTKAFYRAREQIKSQPLFDDAFRTQVGGLVGNRRQQMQTGAKQQSNAGDAPPGVYVPPGYKYIGPAP